MARHDVHHGSHAHLFLASTLDPVSVLKNEHRIIEMVLSAFDVWISGLREESDPRDLAGFVRFFQGFVDGWHDGKEEGLLLPALVEAGFPRDGGPVAVMREEHDHLRNLVTRLAEHAVRHARWTSDDKGDIETLARKYVRLLSDHIRKEDQVLFPMAQTRVPETAWAGMATQMDGLIRGGDEHEHLHQLGESLARRMGVPIHESCCVSYCARGLMGGLD